MVFNRQTGKNVYKIRLILIKKIVTQWDRVRGVPQKLCRANEKAISYRATKRIRVKGSFQGERKNGRANKSCIKMAAQIKRYNNNKIPRQGFFILIRFVWKLSWNFGFCWSVGTLSLNNR